MQTLIQKLSDVVGAAFEAQGLPKDLGIVRVSDRPDLAQFQCNGAMAAAKQAKKNPREVATAIVDQLQAQPIFSKIEIAGPGFINLNVTDDYLAAHVMAGIALPETAHGETAIIDYAQPNVAKPMHVGHLRSSIIGEALKRIMRQAGFTVIGDIHLGDWGTHMGMVVSEYLKTGRADALLSLDDQDEQSVQAALDDLSELYPRVSKLCKEDEARMEEAKAATVQIQNKDPQHYALWQKIRDISVVAQKKNFKKLGIEFDLWWGESTAHDTIAPMVEDLKKRGFAVESDGAWVMPVARNDDKKEVPPVILYKRDGAVMYGTTDLACIIDRMREYAPDRIIYVVDQRQSLHFEQVFRAARMAGLVKEQTELTFAGFGTMNGTDGKPFKTRAGGVMRLDDLLQMAVEKALSRMEESNVAKDMDEAARMDIAQKIGIAALKYADLQNARHADYIFDIDRMTAFEGKTGPYLLYQAVRIKSLLRKAGVADDDAIATDLCLTDDDRPLALLLTQWPEFFDLALKHYAPHYLCEYAYRLAQEFSSFYAKCHIVSEENEALKQSRLSLCAMTYRQLAEALNLLGIDIPDKM